MCCNLRTHTIVIAIICLVFTGLGALNLISAIGGFLHNTVTADANLLYGGNMGLALGTQILIYTLFLLSDGLCLVGALKNNKCLLWPFFIKMTLQILGLLGLAIFFVVQGAKAGNYISGEINDQDVRHATISFGALFFFLLLIPLLITISISIYFLVIVVKFYSELSSGVGFGQTEGIVLQPYSSQPTGPNTGVATVYVPPGGQNVSYGNQQQQQPPAYQQQGYGYPANNPGMKQPV